MGGDHLVCFDTDRIKEYVFATDKLREVRGASWLLTELNERAELERLVRSVCPESEIVFAAGGAAVLLAPSKEKAEEVIDAVEGSYRRKTFAGSITGAAIPLAPATKTEGFGKRVRMAWLKLREAKFVFSLTLENPTERDLGLIALGLQEFIQGMVPLGGIRSRGLGRCHLADVQMAVVDFTQSGDLSGYLQRGWPEASPLGDFITRHIAALLPV